MNIFEVHQEATNQIEPFHSRFLAAALRDSILGDRSLFEVVWRLTTPKGWDVPVEATITAEKDVPGGGRIDICIECESPTRRVVGIEVKTTDSSATQGQLERYLEGLAKSLHDEVAIAYLTPFNRQWARDRADALPTVKEFDEFVKVHGIARHVSWLDIAAISWNGNELWRQHQSFVYDHISSDKKLQLSATRDRPLDQFFREESVAAFREALSDLGIESQVGADTDITLGDFRHETDFADKLAQSFQILVTDSDVLHSANKTNKFPADSRRQFLDSPHRKVHEALFALAERHSHVWVQGEKDYGVRVAHRSHSSGVSLLRSDGPEHLKIVGQR